MWTADNRPRYNRDKLRYPSDLTDAECPPGKPGGGKRRVAPRGRRDVHSQHRQPVARAAQGFAASTITSACGTGRQSHPSCALRPRESRARSQPHGLHRTQSVKSAEKGGLGRCGQADQGRGMFWSIRFCCTALSPPPTFRIATAVSAGDSSVCFPFSGNWRRGPGLSPRPIPSSRWFKGFVVQRRRWVVERTMAQHAADWPRTGRTSTATRSFIKASFDS